MNNINEKAWFAVLLMVVITVIIRLPYTANEINYDSYTLHEMANSIYNNNYSKYDTNMLAVFGLTPASYASLNPFLVAMSAKITNVNTDFIVIIYPILLAIIASLSAYILGMKLWKIKSYALLMSIFFTFSIGVIYLTTYTIRSRAVPTILLPIFFFLVYMHQETKSLKYLIALWLCAILSLLSHKLGYYVVIFLIIYIIYSKLNTIPIKVVYKRVVFLMLPIILFFLTYIIDPFAKIDSGNTYDKNIILHILLNSTSYLRSQNIILIIGIIGYFIYIYQKKQFIEEYVMICFIALVPFVTVDAYMPEFYAFFIAIFATNLLLTMKLKIVQKGKWILSAILIVFISLSAIFTYYHPAIINKSDSTLKEYADNEEMKLYIWIADNTFSRFISNSQFISTRLNVFVNCKSISSDLTAMGCGVLTSDDFKLSLKKAITLYNFKSNPFIVSNRANIETNVKYAFMNDRPNLVQLLPYNISYMLYVKGNFAKPAVLSSNNVIYNSERFVVIYFPINKKV